MGQLEAARHRAELDALHALHLRAGLPTLTRWIANTVRDAAHPDLSRVEPLDRSTIVITRWSGPVTRVALDLAEPCAWCRGNGLAAVTDHLYRPPCEACLGSGLAPGQRGHPAQPVSPSVLHAR